MVMSAGDVSSVAGRSSDEPRIPGVTHAELVYMIGLLWDMVTNEIARMQVRESERARES